MEGMYVSYLQALKRELSIITTAAGDKKLETIFFGGGTPTVLKARQIAESIDHCKGLFLLGSDAEISIEANPGTISVAKARQLLEAGVNRISIGIQSFQQLDLELLGRTHSAKQAHKAVEDTLKSGFENISLDLMYGIPAQTPESWASSLEMALAYQPKHLSLYQLSIEAETRFENMQRQQALQLPSEESVSIMDEISREKCTDAGLQQYEISNFSRPGYECRHNINYWQNRSFMAAGAGAVSYMDGRRRKNEPNPLRYCQQIEQGGEVVVEEEKLANEAAFRETVIMGLRMVKGVSRKDLMNRFGLDPINYYGELLLNLKKKKLLGWGEETLRLTSRGRSFANVVMAELV